MILVLLGGLSENRLRLSVFGIDLLEVGDYMSMFRCHSPIDGYGLMFCHADEEGTTTI